MAVKIIIKRKITPDKENQILPLLLQLRSKAIIQPGYISGETLRRIDSPDEFLVISTWQTLDTWKAWENSEERKQIQSKIDEILGHPTEYSIYYYG